MGGCIRTALIDRAKQLKILVESNRRSLTSVHAALEELESGASERSNYSSMQRAFHTIKHDARHLGLSKLADLAGSCEAIVQQAVKQKLGLPLDLLRRAEDELRTATETIAAGGRHKLDEKLGRRLKTLAAAPRLD